MVQADNLSFAYRRKDPLFDHLNLRLDMGNIYGLLGRNGAGKSTLLKIFSGLLFPVRGQVNVMGFEPKDRLPAFLNEIFIITEEFHLPSMKIEQYIKLHAPFYPRFDLSLMDHFLSEFDLEKDEKLSSLSYGQKKKFLLSFGLATDCKLLIMDEPTNGLDIPSKSQFRKVIASAIHDERSFIISTHQVRDMENLIDPIIILDEGKVIFYQNMEDISRKLCVSRQKEVVNDETIIYAESGFGGYTVIRENIDGVETHLNLEMLFNAVVHNSEKMYKIFNED